MSQELKAGYANYVRGRSGLNEANEKPDQTSSGLLTRKNNMDKKEENKSKEPAQLALEAFNLISEKREEYNNESKSRV